MQYIVKLPGREPSRTEANSESQAVTQYLHRIMPHAQARIQASILKREGHNLADFAFHLPEIVYESGQPIDNRDRELMQVHALSREIATKENKGFHNDSCFQKAKYLLEHSK
jgi:hypothetical protein